MATAVVSPYVLIQELEKARAKGPRGDPYGLATVFRSMGGDFDAMNKSYMLANQTEDSNAKTRATIDSGYYPAHMAAQTTGEQNKAHNNEQMMARAKAIEAAHQEAAAEHPLDSPEYTAKMTQLLTTAPMGAATEGIQMGNKLATASNDLYGSQQKMMIAKAKETVHQQQIAQGKMPGTPEYDVGMRNGLAQYGAAASASTGAPASKALKDLQNRKAAKDMLKQGVMQELIRKDAEAYFQQTTSNAGPPEELDAAWQRSLALARTKLEQNGLRVDMDPEGNMIAFDNQGQQYEVPLRITAAVMKTMNNDELAAALSLVSKETQAAVKSENDTESTRAKMIQAMKEKSGSSKPLVYKRGEYHPGDPYSRKMNELDRIEESLKTFGKAEDLLPELKAGVLRQIQRRDELYSELYGTPSGSNRQLETNPMMGY